MADRGRDVVLRIVSDATKFDLSDVADELEDVGTESADAARDIEKVTDELKRVAAEGKDAERELARIDAELAKNKFDEYGRDAKAAAAKVDDAFDAMARSARDGRRKIDAELEKAGDEGFDDFKDEANSSGREAAASFSGGFEDVTDTIQEIAANAFAGFGPVGAAAGLAAAAGIGILTKGLQDAADRANETKDRVLDLAGAIAEAGGTIAGVDITSRIREWSLAVIDNKSWWEIWQKDNTSNLEIVAAQAEKTGLAFSDLLRGMSGNDTQAAGRTLREIDRRMGEIDKSASSAAESVLGMENASRQLTSAQAAERAALASVRKELVEKSGLTEEAIKLVDKMAEADLLATEASEKNAEAMEAAAAATEEWAEANKAAAETVATSSDDMATAIEKAARRMAKASPEKDSWEDWRDTAVGSINDVIAAQEKDIQAAIDFQTNQEKVFAAVGQAGVDWANAQGENADLAMQMLADAPKNKQNEIVGNYVRLGNLQSEGVGDGMVAGKPVVESAAREVHAAAKRQLDKEIGIPVTVEGAGSAAYQAHREMERYFQNNPITAVVIPSYGTGPGQTTRVT